MKPVSETLELLQNFNEFKGTVQYFNSIFKDYASKGFYWNDTPLFIDSLDKRGLPISISCSYNENYRLSFRNDLPMSLFNAGYRINDFGLLFLSQNNISFSEGSHYFSSFQSKIKSIIRKNFGYEEEKQHSIELVVIELIKTVIPMSK